MTGNELRKVIESKGVSLSATAFAMGLPTPMHLQAVLKSPDVKSSHLESASHALGMTIQDMYAVLGDAPSAASTQPELEPSSAASTTITNDIQQVLFHLVALVTEQNKKIDDLTKQVADLKAVLSAQRNGLRHVLPCNDSLKPDDVEI